MQFTAELIAVLGQELSPTKLNHFAAIIDSIIAISSPVTMRSLARMSPLSYRTIQRFYVLKDVNWLLIRLLLLKAFIYKQDQIYLLAAD